jgi:diketogulonate reductase-like aldo/keto reductase
MNPSDLKFLYGTAWKENLTSACVFEALKAGYRAIDTANQRMHYFEEGVGEALTRAYAKLGLSRDGIFLQSKFTYARGQDHRKPYDEKAAFAVQVQQSFESSLKHLLTDYLDSYVLHGPMSSQGLQDADWETWKSMESLCRNGRVKYLGISNVSGEQLAALIKGASIKPSFVQNRCFADRRWDRDIRDLCSSNGIFYQGFSLLTANAKFLGGHVLRPADRNIPHLVFSEGEENGPAFPPAIQKIANQTGMNIQQIVFRFAQQIGIIPLTGTRSPEHMKSNLEIHRFDLTGAQVQTLENIAFTAAD